MARPGTRIREFGKKHLAPSAMPAGIAQLRRPRRLAEQDLMAQGEVPRLRIVKQSRDPQIELREESEHEAGHGADGERDHEAGAVHAGFLAEWAHGGKV
jgi:hypothetical protein